MIQKITPFLMFNGRLEEAVNFYTSVFKDSKIVSLNRMSATFKLQGQEFMAFDGGPHFSFSEGISLFVSCTTQEDVDTLWEQLSEGGGKSQCGWLKDKFGVSWQIIPNILMKLLYDQNPVKAKNVMNAMLKMNKIIIADLQAAYDME